jgi:hypothetical protein
VSNCSSPCTWALINAYGNNFWTRKPQYWSGQRTGVLQQCLWFWCDTEYPTIAWTIWGGGSGWYAQGWFA